jgi:hypothetical protein
MQDGADSEDLCFTSHTDELTLVCTSMGPVSIKEVL